jgi:pimeloyl-ACP methyl ester carboxylesterase
MSTATRILVVAGAAVILCLSSCALYNRAYENPTISEADLELRVVQADDFGTLWDAAAAQTALDEVSREAAANNVLVVVFVHGWHNNAQPDNANYLDFTKALRALVADLSQPARQQTRKNLTGIETVKVIGLYVGWRGRSLPWILDYATFWSRKSTAAKVGDGDISEFLARLQRIYLRGNSFERYKKTEEVHPYLGLVTIGHSFGGRVVFNAVSRELESNLVERAPCVSIALSPPKNPQNPQQERLPIDSLGDLNILVNPAFEAFQFARIDDLYRQLKYPSDQTPQLVVFSADNDVPRRVYFPIGEALAWPLQPGFRSKFQRQLRSKALGELASQQTHELSPSTDADTFTDADYGTPEGRDRLKAYDFTSRTAFGGAELKPLAEAPVFHNSPVAVVVTHGNIIDGHTGIFLPAFSNFLAPYIAYIEGKRTLMRYAQFQERKRSGAEAPSQSAPQACGAAQ